MMNKLERYKSTYKEEHRHQERNEEKCQCVKSCVSHSTHKISYMLEDDKQHCESTKCVDISYSFIFRMIFGGGNMLIHNYMRCLMPLFADIMILGLTDFVTMLPTVSTVFSPIVTPGQTTLLAPIHAPSAIVIGFTMRSNVDFL